MDIETIYFWGRSKFWWGLILVGLLMIPCGIWLWMHPALGYEVITTIVGWLLIAYGVVQLIVSSHVRRKVPGWGWWLVGGILDILIGFLLVNNLLISETLLPLFFACIFIYKGIAQMTAAFSMISTNRNWGLYFINGLLLLALGALFVVFPFTAMFPIIFLCAIAFIYWGFSLIFFGYSLRPIK